MLLRSLTSQNTSNEGTKSKEANFQSKIDNAGTPEITMPAIQKQLKAIRSRPNTGRPQFDPNICSTETVLATDEVKRLTS